MQDGRMGTGGSAPPSVVAAMWRYRWLVAFVLALSIVLGFAINASKPVEYVATASLIVEDPRASSVDVTDIARQSTQDSERHLADQVEILRSHEAAVLAAGLTGGLFSSDRILEDRVITGDADSNLIEISFRDRSPEAAKSVADALLEAYSELRRSQIQASAQAALAELDALTAAIDADLVAIDGQLQALAATDTDRLELEAQLEEGIRTLNSLRVERDQYPVASEERTLINQRIDELLRDFEAWQAVLAVDVTDPQVVALLSEQAAANQERASLVALRNAIAIDAELAAAGVTLASPAVVPDEPAGIGDSLVMAASLAFGVAVAAVAAYFLSLQGRAVTVREFPEEILGAPLLAEVPDFAHEDITSSLPVKTAPTSAAAEAFRFAAAAIDIRASAKDARMVSVLSGTVGGGKTATVANTGLAAARQGKRILLVDGDFGSQELTRLLTDEPPKRGITDVVDGDVHLLKALVDISQGDGRSISLLSRGSRPVEAASFYQSVLTREFFSHLPMLYDLVLVDCPPLLQVAYASTLAAYTEAAVVLVEHDSSTTELAALADRLDLVGTPVLGYVYSKAPLRREMISGIGSMANKLGTPQVAPAPSLWDRLRPASRA